jgi:sec-independent protein translocase protein TatA
MPQLGPLEIAVVLLIALLVFGPNRLPDLAKQVGGALRELKRIQQNIRDDLHGVVNDASDAASPPPTLPAKGEVIDVDGFDVRADNPGTTAAGEASEPSSRAADASSDFGASGDSDASTPPVAPPPPGQRSLRASATPSPPPPAPRDESP